MTRGDLSTLLVGSPRVPASGVPGAAQPPRALLQQAVMLGAFSPGVFDDFGKSGALDGDTGRAFGTRGGRTDNSLGKSGTAYVFAR